MGASFFSENNLSFTPFINALKGYNGNKLKADSNAGVNVALLAIPQGMAYAAIAEMPIAYGILCTAIAALIAPFFGSSEHTNLGPTNSTALLIASFFAKNVHLAIYKESLVPLIVMLAGIFCVVSAYMKFADMMQYVSKSVLVGYISVAAVLIITKQAKHVLDLSDQVSGSNFFAVWGSIFSNIGTANWVCLGVGLTTFLLDFVLRKKFKKLPIFAIVLITMTLAVQGLSWAFPTSDFASLPRFSAFNLADLAPQGMKVVNVNIFDAMSDVLTIAIAVAFLAILENSSMSKSLASKAGTSSDVNQDTLSVGMSNIVSGFFSGIPASGSLTRSALNFSSGAMTRVSSWVSGGLSLGAVFLLAFVPVTAYIPKVVLSALVIGIAATLFNTRMIRICTQTTAEDAFVLILTFGTALFAPLHIAIFIGVAVSVALFLGKVSRPDMVEYTLDDGGQLQELSHNKRRHPNAISIVHVEGSLFFGAAELFQNQMKRLAHEPEIACVVLRMKNARHLDATSVVALEELVRFLRRRGRHVLISGATRDIYRLLKKSGVLGTIQEGADRSKGESNIFLMSPQNPNVSTRNALKRAQQLLGDKHAEIKIYVDPNKSK